MSRAFWTPRADDLEHSKVARLMRKHEIDSVWELRTKSALSPEWFYPAMIEDLGIELNVPPEKLYDDSKGLPFTDWFVGARLNIVHNCLDRHLLAGHGDRVAVIAENDSEQVDTLTYQELDHRVCRLSSVLHGLGIAVGDAVGFYLPMTADVVVALLACLKIGAVPVPVFAGFGPEALAERLQAANARVLLTADGTFRRGKAIELKSLADRGAELAGCVDHTLVLLHTGQQVAWNPKCDRWWHEEERRAPSRWPTSSLDASARSLILFTSGTTGKPKGAIHTHIGVQLVTAKEVGYHLDVRAGDTMFWLTDIGWMMGPWEILGVLFHRGTVVLLDGAPNHPDGGRIWRMVERHKITHLAMAPTAVRMLKSHGDALAKRHDLSSLRILGSTGEPWDDDSYRWFAATAAEGRAPIINISGGTELMGCLLAPLVVAPIEPCSLQGQALGMNVDVVDGTGASLRGEVGHLVCRNAAPNMTRGFLDDNDRYLDTYFTQFGQEVWAHGDWAKVDKDGFWYITGRADDTLKIAGKRIGPAEVEAAAADHDAVHESAAVGLPDELKGTRLILVVVASRPELATADVAEDLRQHISAKAGSTMRPAEIVWVQALPVTRSGKILRGMIRRVLAGEPTGDLASVANPEAIDAIRATLD